MVMPFTVTEFRNLIHFLETQPEWRMELRRLLFPEALVDLPRALEELAEAQRRTEETLAQVTERMERGFAEAAVERAEAAADRKRIWEAMQQGFAEAAAERAEAAADRKRIWEAMQQGFAEAAAEREEMRRDIGVLRRDVGVLRRDVGVLKGSTKEGFYRDRAAAIFGRLLAAGQDATQEVVQRLRAAQQASRVSAEEYQSVLNADLLWSGKLWDTGEEVVLVLEASWKVHESDVDRAVQRAEVLRRAGLNALPVTAGEEWPEQVEALALRERVVIARDGRVDDVSWQAALAGLQ
jgi:rubrerythrin